MTEYNSNPIHKNAKDITGQTFNEWTVLGYSHYKVYGGSTIHLWFCRCSCGTVRSVQGRGLKSGRSTSCGCTRRRTITHGMTDTPTHNSWRGMMERCKNPNHVKYADYGGRGISVCKEWESFENFFRDMGERPSKGQSLDRIDNEGNYEPGNCQWSTQVQQTNNTRTNHNITFNGRTMTMRQWANETGIKYSTLAARLNILKWPIERALTASVSFHHSE